MVRVEITSEEQIMGRHAYLITAYNEFELLKKLVILLDDERNDIYVHMDKKSDTFNITDFENLTRKSRLTFVKRHKVSWGGYSLLNCELVLLKEAARNMYAYYHLISGLDLPLKSQDEIHSFFDEHPGTEFLGFDNNSLTKKSFYDRFRYYYIFQESMGRKRGWTLLNLLNKISFKTQDFLGVDRIKNTKSTLRKGLNWFSITHDLAMYVIAQEGAIQKTYRYTLCPEETFLHTIAWNSKFKENICDNSLRKSVWKRGGPYTFRAKDFDTLVNSGAFWARKFSEKIDPVIVEKIYHYVKGLS